MSETGEGSGSKEAGMRGRRESPFRCRHLATGTGGKPPRLAQALLPSRLGIPRTPWLSPGCGPKNRARHESIRPPQQVRRASGPL